MCITRFVPCLVFFYLCMMALPGCKPPAEPKPMLPTSKTVVVYCTKPCHACDMLKVQLAQVRIPNVRIVYVDDEAAARQAGVVAFPTMNLYVDTETGSQLVATTVGYMTLPELLAWIERDGR